MTCTDSPKTAAWDDLVQLALHARPDNAAAWHAPGIRAALRDACTSDRTFTFAELVRVVITAAMNPESRTPVVIGFDAAWTGVAGAGKPSKVYGWTEGDPRYICGICDLSEPACRARANTNGHEYMPRTECLPPTEAMWTRPNAACMGGAKDAPCPLPAGHDGSHTPPLPVRAPRVRGQVSSEAEEVGV